MEYLNLQVDPPLDVYPSDTWEWMRVLAGATGSQFKGIKMLADLDMNNFNIINWSGSSGPTQALTGDNLGTGAKLFKAKVLNDLQFRSIIAGSTKLTVTENTNDISFDLGSVKLADLDDVDLTGLVDKQLLRYDATAVKWKPSDLSSQQAGTSLVWRPGGSTAPGVFTGNAAALNTEIANKKELSVIYIDSFNDANVAVGSEIDCLFRVALVGLRRQANWALSMTSNIKNPRSMSNLNFVANSGSPAVILASSVADKYLNYEFVGCSFEGKNFFELDVGLDTANRGARLSFQSCSFSGTLAGVEYYFDNDQGTVDLNFVNTIFESSATQKLAFKVSTPVANSGYRVYSDSSSIIPRVTQTNIASPAFYNFLTGAQQNPLAIDETTAVLTSIPKVVKGFTPPEYRKDSGEPWALNDSLTFIDTWAKTATQVLQSWYKAYWPYATPGKQIILLNNESGFLSGTAGKVEFGTGMWQVAGLDAGVYHSIFDGLPCEVDIEVAINNTGLSPALCQLGLRTYTTADGSVVESEDFTQSPTFKAVNNTTADTYSILRLSYHKVSGVNREKRIVPVIKNLEAITTTFQVLWLHWRVTAHANGGAV